jgi:AcrR family transcriptional regulator
VTGRRERKKRATYETLRRVTLDMCEAQGFTATTIDQIADAADVSPRTFFRYFATKQEALLADQHPRLQALRDLLRERPAAEPVLESVAAAVAFLRDDAVEQRETLLLQARVARDEPQVMASLLAHHVEVQRTLHAFVRARTPADPLGIRAHALSDVPFGVFCDALNAWLLRGAPETFDVPTDEVYAWLERSAVSP